MKKVAVVLLAVCILFAGLTSCDNNPNELPAVPEETSSWDGTTLDTEWYKAEEREFTLTEASQIAGLAKLVNEGVKFEGTTITLEKNLDLGNFEWTPIGTKDNSFDGIFDGNNKTISNLKISNTGEIEEGIGFFGYVKGKDNAQAEVKNVTFKKASITSDKAKTGLIGIAQNAKITGVVVDNCTINTSMKNAGAIIGTVYSNCIIENCQNINSSVISTGVYNAGGIAGSVNGGEVSAEGKPTVVFKNNKVDLTDAKISITTSTAAFIAATAQNGVEFIGNKIEVDSLDSISAKEKVVMLFDPWDVNANAYLRTNDNIYNTYKIGNDDQVNIIIYMDETYLDKGNVIVNRDGSIDYRTINEISTEEELVNAAKTGGKYCLANDILINQKLDITAPIELYGNGKTISRDNSSYTESSDNTIIDINSGNVTLKGLTVKGTQDAKYDNEYGIFANENVGTVKDQSVILDNVTITNTYIGLYIDSAQINTKHDIVVDGNKYCGIYLSKNGTHGVFNLSNATAPTTTIVSSSKTAPALIAMNGNGGIYNVNALGATIEKKDKNCTYYLSKTQSIDDFNK